MNSKQTEGARHYLGEVPFGRKDTDGDPYYQVLEEESSENMWNQHLPSEFIIERMERLYEHLRKQSPELAKKSPQ